MSFSVALCTYNGAAYIIEQLQSILNGSVLPRQIVICDDGSDDSTVSLLNDFKINCPIPIELHVNVNNLGYVKNFEKAISLCREPIVFLSDQDDIWLRNKAETLLARFDNPAVGGVFSDATLAQADLSPMGITMFSRLLSAKHRKELLSGNADTVFRFLLLRPIVTGATLAVRRSLVSEFLPFPSSKFFIHDGWLALCIAACSTLDVVPQPLITYRQHPGQQVGLPKNDIAEDDHRARYPTLRRHYARFYKELETLLNRPTVRPEARQIFREAVKHNELRLSLAHRQLSRPIAIVGDLINGRYSRYSSGPLSAIKDLISPQPS